MDGQTGRQTGKKTVWTNKQTDETDRERTIRDETSETGRHTGETDR